MELAGWVGFTMAIWGLIGVIAVAIRMAVWTIWIRPRLLANLDRALAHLTMASARVIRGEATLVALWDSCPYDDPGSLLAWQARKGKLIRQLERWRSRTALIQAKLESIELKLFYGKTMEPNQLVRQPTKLLDFPRQPASLSPVEVYRRVAVKASAK